MYGKQQPTDSQPGSMPGRNGKARRQRISRLALPALCLVTAIHLGLMAGFTKIATIRMGESVAVMRTVNSDPTVILSSSAFALQPTDLVRVEEGGPTFINLSIERKYPVTITADGQTTTHETYGGTVFQVLREAGLTVNDGDLPSDPFNTQTYAGMHITLRRVRYETVVQELPIDYDVQRVPSVSVPEGKVKETRAGKPGLAVTTLENKYLEQTLVDSRTLSREVVAKPVDAIVQYGTGGTVSTSRSDATRFSYMLDMTATAYTYGENGKWGDVTATGKDCKVGYVAVDPRVIPLGSRLYIVYPNGKHCYGFATAEDTGGAIKGNRIDLFYESHEEAVQFGRRTVRVYILSDG